MQSLGNLSSLAGLGIPHGAGGVSAPPGFILLVDYDGAYLIDADGAYLMEPV